MKARTIVACSLLSCALLAGPSRADDPFQRGIPESQVQRLDAARRLETSAAIESMTELLRENPDYYRAHYNLGLAYLNSGKPKDALPHLEKARSLRETEGAEIRDSTIYNSLGWAQFLAGDLEAAQRTFEKGKAEAGSAPRASNAKLFNNLGTLYLEKGDLETARHYFSEAATKYGSDKARANLKYLGTFEGLAANQKPVLGAPAASAPPSP